MVEFVVVSYSDTRRVMDIVNTFCKENNLTKEQILEWKFTGSTYERPLGENTSGIDPNLLVTSTRWALCLLVDR
jgi:hypothetical protein